MPHIFDPENPTQQPPYKNNTDGILYEILKATEACAAGGGGGGGGVTITDRAFINDADGLPTKDRVATSAGDFFVQQNAANAGYTPVGSDAVKRLVADKLKETVSVEDFGAIKGASVTPLERAINDTAFFKAFSYALANNATILLSGVYAVNTTLDFSNTNPAMFTHINMVGQGRKSSGIISYSSNVGIDLGGRNYMGFRDMTIEFISAEIGVLMYRNNLSPNCNNNSFVNVHFLGNCHFANVASIAAESLNFINCKFENTSDPGKRTYYTSSHPSDINSELFSHTPITSSNTDIHAIGCEYYCTRGEASVIELNASAGISFTNCRFIAGGSSDSCLVKYTSNVDRFNGPVNYISCLFEGGTNQFKFAIEGLAYYYYISVKNCFFNSYGAGDIFAYYSQSSLLLFFTYHANIVYENNSTLHFKTLVNSKVNHLVYGGVVNITGSFVLSDIECVEMHGSYQNQKSQITIDGQRFFGDYPTIGVANFIDNGVYKSHGTSLVIGPTDAQPAQQKQGSIQTFVGIPNANEPGFLPLGFLPQNNDLYTAVYNGTEYRHIGSPLSYSPASSTDAGNVGTWAMDDNFVYIKVNSGLWKKTPIYNIENGKKQYVLNDGDSFLLKQFEIYQGMVINGNAGDSVSIGTTQNGNEVVRNADLDAEGVYTTTTLLYYKTDKTLYVSGNAHPVTIILPV